MVNDSSKFVDIYPNRLELRIRPYINICGIMYTYPYLYYTYICIYIYIYTSVYMYTYTYTYVFVVSGPLMGVRSGTRTRALRAPGASFPQTWTPATSTCIRRRARPKASMLLCGIYIYIYATPPPVTYLLWPL